METLHQDPTLYEKIREWCSMPPKLIGKRIFLTAPDPECADEILSFKTDERVASGLGDPLYRADTADEIYGELSAASCNIEDGFNFLIWHIEEQRVIGTCQLMNIRQPHRTATLGIGIGPRKLRGQGLGQETIKLLLDFAFEELDLYEVNLVVYSFNEAAIKCYEKCGFKEYGRRRESWYAHGKRHDEILMDILKREYLEAKNA